MGILKLEDSAFVFNSYKADVRTEISIGSSKYNNSIDMLKISADDSLPVKFAYEIGEGLIEIKNVNTKKAQNILGMLLKIKKNDYNDYIDFVNSYGFFFPLESDRIIKVQPYYISQVAERLKVVTELINEIGNTSSIDCRKVMELSLFLFFDDGWQIDLNTRKESSYEYELASKIENAFDNHEIVSKQEAINKGFYTIKDSLYDTNELSADEYKEIIDGSSSNVGWDDFRFRALTYLYANKNNFDKRENEIIDLLFHFFIKVGIPKEITADGITYYSKYNTYGCYEYSMIDSVINFGKYVINKEINHGIRGITPECDLETMKPKWTIPSLMSALYFSLFYLDKSSEMMRKCEHCGTYFVVKRSSSTKKYCSSYCRNNAQQAKHRTKVKQSK